MPPGRWAAGGCCGRGGWPDKGLLLAALTCAVLWLIVLPLVGELLALLGATGRIHRWAEDYSKIIFIGVPVFIFAFALNGILHAVGNTKAFRNGIAAAAAANVVLDPVLMFGWFGLPPLGIKGIALGDDYCAGRLRALSILGGVP